MTFPTSQAWDAFCQQRADQAQALGRCSLAGVGKKHRQKAVILPTPTEETRIEQFAISNSVKVTIWYDCNI